MIGAAALRQSDATVTRIIKGFCKIAGLRVLEYTVPTRQSTQ
jgi:hypothetical protein